MTSCGREGDVDALSKALCSILSSTTPMARTALPMAGHTGPQASAFSPGNGQSLPAGPFPGASAVRPSSGDPEEVQVHFALPDGLAGAILGKGGARVKETEQLAGCRVSVSQRDGTGDRRVVMVGHAQQVGTAQGIVHDQLQDAAKEAGLGELQEITAVLFVRRSAAGAVIGKSGAGLKHVRETSEAKVSLAREEVLGQRPCTIAGTLHQVLEAERCVLELIRSVPVLEEDFESNGTKRALPGGPESYAGLPLAKRARVESEGSTKILVPAEHVGRIIGKQGAGLRSIREGCGVQVEASQQSLPQFPQDRIFSFWGPTRSRHAAALMVLRTAFGGVDDNVVLKLLVPHQLAGTVIGKGGANLKFIREQCGVGPRVEREDLGGERLVHCTGPAAAVSDALQIILTKLDGEDNGNSSVTAHEVDGYTEAMSVGYK